jgi:hypothetical protein
MAIKTTDVRRDMEVYSADGKKIGCVSEVYGSEFGGEPGTTPPSGVGPTGEPLPFLRVSLNRIGHNDIYIPADGVQEVVPGQRVVLACSKDECERLYARSPGR